MPYRIQERENRMPVPVPIDLLLVEDNEFDLELTLDALRPYHARNRVHVLRDGAAALDYFFSPASAQAPPPRMVLLDLNLPKIDGFEVLRRLKNDPTTGAVPVVVMTSSPDEIDFIESRGARANAYVVKPVRAACYADALRAVAAHASSGIDDSAR